MSFSLKKNDNGNWVEVTNNYATVLEPNDQVRLDCETSDYNNLSDIHIYVLTDKDMVQIELENSFSTSNIFNIPELYSSDHTINFKIEGIDSSSEEGEMTSETLTFNNYNCPVKFSVEQVVVQRVPENYLDPSVNGTYMKAENIQFVLDSGVLEDITDIQIKIYKDDEFLSDVIIDRSVIINDFFDNDGYHDGETYQSDVDKTYLFNDINTSDDNPFEDIAAKFYFSFILTYKKLKPNSGGSEWEYEYNFSTEESQRYIYRRGVTSLYLVGKTEIDENTPSVYGGVTIGQAPTMIKTIRKPTFECGYQAYFNSTTNFKARSNFDAEAFFKGYKFGFWPGDKILVASGTVGVPGFINGNGSSSTSTHIIYFTIRLGQPIFANNVKFSANSKCIIRVSDAGYINGATGTQSGLSMTSGWSIEMVDKRTGTIRFWRESSGQYKKYVSSGTAPVLPGNQPLFLTAYTTNNPAIYFEFT